jgi:hypothetical protein
VYLKEAKEVLERKLSRIFDRYLLFPPNAAATANLNLAPSFPTPSFSPSSARNTRDSPASRISQSLSSLPSLSQTTAEVQRTLNEWLGEGNDGAIRVIRVFRFIRVIGVIRVIRIITVIRVIWILKLLLMCCARCMNGYVKREGGLGGREKSERGRAGFTQLYISFYRTIFPC